jgi:hypothetical protein
VGVLAGQLNAEKHAKKHEFTQVGVRLRPTNLALKSPLRAYNCAANRENRPSANYCFTSLVHRLLSNDLSCDDDGKCKEETPV